jgi:hypothetical protein
MTNPSVLSTIINQPYYITKELQMMNGNTAVKSSLIALAMYPLTLGLILMDYDILKQARNLEEVRQYENDMWRYAKKFYNNVKEDLESPSGSIDEESQHILSAVAQIGKTKKERTDKVRTERQHHREQYLNTIQKIIAR